MKTVILDIETTDLSAVGAGVILCVVIKPYLAEPETYRVDEYCGPWEPREARMLNDLLARLVTFHCVVGHNIKKFDWPYLRSRAHILGVPFIPNPLYYDTLVGAGHVQWMTRLNGYGKPTKALAHLIDFMGTEQQKTGIYPRQWWRAVWSTGAARKSAMDEIVEHCIADVRMTEELYEAILTDDNKAIIRRF